MPVPDPHRNPTADRAIPWDWAGNAPRYTDELMAHGGWKAMVTAHAWHAAADDGTAPERKGTTSCPTIV